MKKLLILLLFPLFMFAQDSTLVGDVDCSGEVNSQDASLILQFVTNVIDSLPCEANMTGLTPDQLQEMIDMMEDQLSINYTAGSGGSGFDLSFPDGYDGETINWGLFNNDYTVPLGKNLYITHLFVEIAYYIKINGKSIFGYDDIGVNNEIRSPLVVGEGEVVSFDGGVAEPELLPRFYGILVDANVTPITFEFEDAGNPNESYTVPDSQKLIITNILNYTTYDVVLINGDDVFMNTYNNFGGYLEIPLILNSGDVIAIDDNTSAFNGYLVDEDYFSSAGSGSNSAALDSTMVADMIQSALSNSVSIGIGDYYQGGNVVHIFQPEEEGYVFGEVHGYIMYYNSNMLSPWGCEQIITTATSYSDGALNTEQILNSCDEESFAAKYCDDLIIASYDDWFLPSPSQLLDYVDYLNDYFGDVSLWTSCEWYVGASDEGGYSPGIIPPTAENPAYNYARVIYLYGQGGEFYWKIKSDQLPFVAFRQF